MRTMRCDTHTMRWSDPLAAYDMTPVGRFKRPVQPKLPMDEYKVRVGKFWEEARAEYSWWCKEYGPAQGAVFFWALAETQWLWDTLVKGWTVSDEEMAALVWDALLQHTYGGNTDGLWRSDEEPKESWPGQDQEDLGGIDKSWVTYTVPAKCPF
jgi:hypothetical protein